MEQVRLNVVRLDGSSRIRWEGKYPLVHLADPPAPIRLPGRQVWADPGNLHEVPRLLVFGERSGGGRDFIHWWRSSLDEAGHCWIYAQGDKWRRSFFEPEIPQGGPAGNSSAEDLKDRATLLEKGKEALEKFGGRDDAGKAGRVTEAERAEHLVRWAAELDGQQQKVYLILRDFEGLGSKDEALAMAVALRIAGENQFVRSRLRILVVSSSGESFNDLADASGFGAMCDRYRLAWLRMEEIDRLASEFQPDDSSTAASPISLDPHCLEAVMEGTGGQPYLVQNLLRFLGEKGLFQPQPGAMRQVLREMRAAPPPAVAHWTADLRGRLDGNRALEQSLRPFLSGVTQGETELSSELSSLFLGGWLRFDWQTRRWKVSSKIHRSLALEVLEQIGGR
jgi:hypothetical protein